jgi:ATP-dependent Clp protease adaptor protein ClpS
MTSEPAFADEIPARFQWIADRGSGKRERREATLNGASGDGIPLVRMIGDDKVITRPRTVTKPKVERPKLHKVILINDDFTPREFVVTVLKGEFRLSEDQAYRVMITAHRRGVCVIAVFPKDVAETKAMRATDAGKAKGYPLMFTTEPEE